MKKTLVVLFALAILIFAVACSSSPEKTGYLLITAEGIEPTHKVVLMANGTSFAACEVKSNSVLFELPVGVYQNLSLIITDVGTGTINDSAIVITAGQTTKSTASVGC